MRWYAGFTLAWMLSTLAIAAEPAGVQEPGEAEKAAAISKLEAEIEAATDQKTKAAKEDDRHEVKLLTAELKRLRLELSKAKSKPPEKFAEEAAERARAEEEAVKLAAEKKRKEAEHERLWPKKEREANERKAAAGFPMPAGEDGVDIVFAAQAAVKTRLKNPAGAKFPSIWRGVDVRSHCKYNGDGTYTVNSWVDATNSFNAQLRVPYVAKLKKGSGGIEVIDVVLIE